MNLIMLNFLSNSNQGRVLKILSILMILLIFNAEASGSFKDLAGLFLTENSGINSIKNNRVSTKLERDLILEKRTLSLSVTPGYTDSSLDSSTTLSPLEFTNSSLNLGLSREFIWGGTLSVDTSLSNTEYSSNNSKLGNGGQQVSYSQDLGKNIFGRNSFKEEDKARFSYNLNQLKLSISEEDSLHEFYREYLDLIVNNELLKLQKESLKRAKARLDLVRKRVKDGLKEKVDLYQAKSSLLETNEKVLGSELRVLRSKDYFYNNLHGKIDLDEYITGFNFKRASEKDFSFEKGNILENKKYQLLEKDIVLQKKSYEIAKNNIFPEISLNLSYETNDYKDTKASFLDGSLSDSSNAKSISVSMTMPLSFGNEKRKKEIESIRLKNLEYHKLKKYDSLVEIESLLREKIFNSKQKISFSKKRINFAKMSLEEYTRLYERGKATFDQIIRSEETLIQNQVDFLNSYFQLKKMIAVQNDLYGNLTRYLLK